MAQDNKTIDAKALMELLEQCWQAMLLEYENGLINSEATMQASLYLHLRSLNDHLKIFLEPCLESKSWSDSKKTYIPDMVICQEKKVLAIVELKLAPEYFFYDQDDIEKLHEYYKHWNENKLPLSETGQPLDLDPALGEYKSSTSLSKANYFVRADDVLLVFGLITRRAKRGSALRNQEAFKTGKLSSSSEDWAGGRYRYLSKFVGDDNSACD